MAGKGTNRKYFVRYLSQYTRKNNVVIVLGALFILGVVLGSLLLRSAGEESANLLERMLGGMIQNRRNAGLYENFVSALRASLLFWAAMFICGFCAVAQPVIIMAPFIRGLGFGFSMASLYIRHGASAVGFVSVLILPGMLISTVAILLCCRQALRLANTFFSTMRRGSQGAEPYSIQSYCFRFLLAAGLCVLAAFVEAVLYFGFANYFVLG